MTEATERALEGLRDFSSLQWYVVPLLAFVFWIYVNEIRSSRESGDWRALIAGVALFGADFFNETWNSWVMVLSGRSALWTTPGPSALRLLVGWNLEIAFMFAILGIVYYRSYTDEGGARILGIPERWIFALGYSLVCVVIECILNAGGLLVWDYSFWTRSLVGVVPIFLVGYFWFFAWVILATTRRTTRAMVSVAAIPYVLAILMHLIAAALGMRY